MVGAYTGLRQTACLPIHHMAHDDAQLYRSHGRSLGGLRGPARPWEPLHRADAGGVPRGMAVLPVDQRAAPPGAHTLWMAGLGRAHTARGARVRAPLVASHAAGGAPATTHERGA